MPRAKTVEIGFPRTLYKPADKDDPTATKCGNANRGNAYHSVLVNDGEERKAAMQMGYYDNFAKACAVNLDNEEETDGNSETESESESDRAEDSTTGEIENEEEINAKGTGVSERTEAEDEKESVEPSKEKEKEEDGLLDKGF